MEKQWEGASITKKMVVLVHKMKQCLFSALLPVS